MSACVLPSGRVLNLKERPSWGDWVGADNAGKHADENGDNYTTARATHLMAAMASLTTEEVMALDLDDANALASEVALRSQPRSEEEERPFANSSRPTSAATPSRTRPRRS